MIGREVVHNMSNELGGAAARGSCELCPDVNPVEQCQTPDAARGSWSRLHLGRCGPSQQGEDALRLSACSETGFAGPLPSLSKSCSQ